ncbi:hypothetical protein OAD26_00280 [bacterium]|nr:hypothetical protein [bacterium]
METPKFTKKIEASMGIEGLEEKLTEAPLSELTSILRSSFKERAESVNPADVLKEYRNKKEFFGPSEIDQREQEKYRAAFFDILPENIQSLELSPVAPFGTNSSISNLSQDLMCTTIRRSEVQGDPTTALALEASEQRRQKLLSKETVDEEVRLATATRILRMQEFDKERGYMQHYNLYGLYSSGRDIPGLLFGEQASIEHISLWLNLLNKLKDEGLLKSEGTKVYISDIKILEKLVDTLDIPRDEINQNVLNEDWDMFQDYGIGLPSEIESIADIPVEELEKYGIGESVKNISFLENTILRTLRASYPEVDFKIQLNRKGGLGYYSNLCFNVYAKDESGQDILVAGGGSVDWSSKLLGNTKEKGFSSGFGPEYVQKLLS